MQFQTYRGLLSAKECIHRLSSHKNIDFMTHPISPVEYPYDALSGSGPWVWRAAPLFLFLSFGPHLLALAWAASFTSMLSSILASGQSQFWNAVQALCLELAPFMHPSQLSYIVLSWLLDWHSCLPCCEDGPISSCSPLDLQGKRKQQEHLPYDFCDDWMN